MLAVGCRLRVDIVADNIESVSGETFSDVSSITAIDGIVMGDAYISG